MIDYKEKYLKYKIKYLNAKKKIKGGEEEIILTVQGKIPVNDKFPEIPITKQSIKGTIPISLMLEKAESLNDKVKQIKKEFLEEVKLIKEKFLEDYKEDDMYELELVKAGRQIYNELKGRQIYNELNAFYVFFDPYDKHIKKFYGIKNESDMIEDKSDMIEDKSDMIEDKSDMIEDKSDMIEDKSDMIEDKSDMIEDKSDMIEDKSDMIEDKSDMKAKAKEHMDSYLELKYEMKENINYMHILAEVYITPPLENLERIESMYTKHNNKYKSSGVNDYSIPENHTIKSLEKKDEFQEMEIENVLISNIIKRILSTELEYEDYVESDDEDYVESDDEDIDYYKFSLFVRELDTIGLNIRMAISNINLNIDNIKNKDNHQKWKKEFEDRNKKIIKENEDRNEKLIEASKAFNQKAEEARIALESNLGRINKF